jgi:YidC/Oxa1 family membrane protein insertase
VGLVIYYAWNNLLSVAQQWYIMKREGADVSFFNKRAPKKLTAAND